MQTCAATGHPLHQPDQRESAERHIQQGGRNEQLEGQRAEGQQEHSREECIQRSAHICEDVEPCQGAQNHPRRNGWPCQSQQEAGEAAAYTNGQADTKCAARFGPR